MSAWFTRILLFIVVCSLVAYGYPASISKHQRLQEHLGYRPNGIYEVLSDNTDNDLNEADGVPIWLFRSRKFCCAPPL